MFRLYDWRLINWIGFSVSVHYAYYGDKQYLVIRFRKYVLKEIDSPF